MERQTEQNILKMLERKRRKNFVRNEVNHIGGFSKLALLDEFALIVGIVLVGMHVFQLLNPFIMDSFLIQFCVAVGTLIVGLTLAKKFVQVHIWGCDKFGINDWN